jgi:hypothetical protein
LVLRHPISDEDRQNLLTSLVQFPLFAAAARPGAVSFKHELLAEYLFGRQLAKAIRSGQPRTLRALDKLAERPLLRDTLSFQLLIKEVSSNEHLRSTVAEELCNELVGEKLFKILLQLWISSGTERMSAPKQGLFETRDLSGIIFNNMNLSQASFRRSNLTDTSFVGCDLKGAYFEGAHLVGTVFRGLQEEALRGARFGNFDHFQYIYAGTRPIENRQDAKVWAAEQTGVPEPLADPCATTSQIRALFSKFVREDGTGRRDELPRHALARGRNYEGAPTLEDCIECCVRRSFLKAPDYRDRIKRPTGEPYNEIVRFMKDWTMSAGIKDVLDELCPTRACKHLP